MKLEVHIHHHGSHMDGRDFEYLRNRIHELERTVMGNKQEALDLIEAQNAKVIKIGTETDALKARVAELETAVENAGDSVPDEVIAKLKGVTDQLDVVDDKVADAQPTPPSGGGSGDPG